MQVASVAWATAASLGCTRLGRTRLGRTRLCRTRLGRTRLGRTRLGRAFEGLLFATVISGAAGPSFAQVSADSLESALSPRLGEIDPLGTLVQTVLYLGLISVVIYAFIKWVLPRFLGGRLVGKGRLEMVEQLHLGGRRSVCVVRSGNREYLLGVTDQQVRLLDVLEESDSTGGRSSAEWTPGGSGSKAAPNSEFGSGSGAS